MNGELSKIAAGALTRDASSAGEQQTNPRNMLIAATVITLILMFVPYSNFLLYPLRLFVTFVHESGHAISGVLTGGSVDSLTVFPNGEGVTLVRAPYWSQWIVDSGGYLGAAVFGALMLQVGRLSHLRSAGKATLYTLSIFLLGVVLLWSHNPLNNLFTFVAGIVLAGALWLAARFLSPRSANFVAAFLAVQCSMNAISDLRILVNITQHHLGDNDASNMQAAYGLPATFWAVLWAGMALLLLGLSLRSYWRATRAFRAV